MRAGSQQGEHQKDIVSMMSGHSASYAIHKTLNSNRGEKSPRINNARGGRNTSAAVANNARCFSTGSQPDNESMKGVQRILKISQDTKGKPLFNIAKRERFNEEAESEI